MQPLMKTDGDLFVKLKKAQRQVETLEIQVRTRNSFLFFFIYSQNVKY